MARRTVANTETYRFVWDGRSGPGHCDTGAQRDREQCRGDSVRAGLVSATVPVMPEL